VTVAGTTLTLSVNGDSTRRWREWG